MLPVELTAPALFIAGATTSLHCALMCGAVNAAQVASHGPVPLHQTLALVHGGRVLGYALLGALAGFAGGSLAQWLPETVAGRSLQQLAAVALVVAGIQQWRGRRHATPADGCTRKIGVFRVLFPLSLPPRSRLLAQGLAWALMPCGILYTVLLLAALTTSPVAGFVLLAAFGLGTVPLMGVSGGLFGLATRPQDTRWLRHAAGAVLIVLGVAGLVFSTLHGGSLPEWLCVPGQDTQGVLGSLDRGVVIL